MLLHFIQLFFLISVSEGAGCGDSYSQQCAGSGGPCFGGHLKPYLAQHQPKSCQSRGSPCWQDPERGVGWNAVGVRMAGRTFTACCPPRSCPRIPPCGCTVVTSSEHLAETRGASPTGTAKANDNEASFPSWVRIEPCPTASNGRIIQLQHFSIPREAAIPLSSSLPLGSQ